jgi:release factor glutamine methyltransferase
MLTVLEIIKRTTDFFEKRGVESARLNAELIIGHALALKRMQLYLQFERPLSEVELEKIRPETEYLIELVARRLTEPPASILDLGTGSGAIALALAKAYPEAAVTAVDKNAEALALARENAIASGLEQRVRFLESDWFAAIGANEKFVLIVANPPYLSDRETAEAPQEVREFEPMTALSSGVDGTTDLSRIISQAPAHLDAGGMLACETGVAQQDFLTEAAGKAGYVRTESLQDLTGRERYFLAFV